MPSNISDVFGGAAAIAKGMSVTFKEMLNPTIIRPAAGKLAGARIHGGRHSHREYGLPKRGET